MRTATTAIAILIVSTFATSHAVAQDQRVASATRSVPECDSNDRTVEVALDKSGQSNPAVNARGVLSEDIVEDVVRERLADIRACYVDALERDPALSGGVEVVWGIGRDGAAMCTSVLTATRCWRPATPLTRRPVPCRRTTPCVLAMEEMRTMLMMMVNGRQALFAARLRGPMRHPSRAALRHPEYRISHWRAPAPWIATRLRACLSPVRLVMAMRTVTKGTLRWSAPSRGTATMTQRMLTVAPRRHASSRLTLRRSHSSSLERGPLSASPPISCSSSSPSENAASVAAAPSGAR